ncbi:MAG TPA: SapC family protein [Burkholderiales bacterium]|nr:SapC family protein [Burkholderiales bacterium]
MLFYERAIALNRERHQKLKLEPAQNHFAFASQTNAMLLASTELAEAARDYPIVFVGAEGGPFTLAALVGLRNSENLLVDASGRWEANTYVPAFARRYPFVLAEGEDKSILTVCVDETYPGLNEERGEALFDGDGKETAYLQRVLEFLRAFHTDMTQTRDFAARLNALGLLVSKVITIEQQRTGEPQRQVLEGLWIVDEEKLRAIDDARIVELFRNGYMGWIYAHLLSLGNVRRLAARLDRASRLADDSTLGK